jgi:hypothetical protein
LDSVLLPYFLTCFLPEYAWTICHWMLSNTQCNAFFQLNRYFGT